MCEQETRCHRETYKIFIDGEYNRDSAASLSVGLKPETEKALRTAKGPS